MQAKLEEQEKAIADLQTQRDELAQNLHARWEAAADLQAQLDSTAAAKSAGDEKLQASEAELAGLKEQLASWQSDLHSALPEDARPAEAAAVVEDQAAKEGSAAGPAVTAGAVAAGIAALVALSRQRDAELTQLAEKNATLEAQVHATGAKGPAAPAIPIAYAVLQAPKTIVHELGPTPTENIYGRVYVPGLTDEAGDPDGISAEVGFGAQGSDPTTWSTWQPLVYNAICDACGHNYEYMGKLNPDVAGTFDLLVRFSDDGGRSWIYGYQDSPDGSQPGLLVVNPGSDIVAGEREEVGAAVALGPEPVTEAPQPEAPPAESSARTEPAEAEPEDAAVAASPEAVLPEPEAQLADAVAAPEHAEAEPVEAAVAADAERAVSEAEAPLAVSAAIAEQAKAEAEHTEATAAASPESTPAEVQPIATSQAGDEATTDETALAESKPPVAAAAMVAETAHKVFEAEAQPVEPAAEASQQLPVEEAAASAAAVAVAETAPEAPAEAQPGAAEAPETGSFVPASVEIVDFADVLPSEPERAAGATEALAEDSADFIEAEKKPARE